MLDKNKNPFDRYNKKNALILEGYVKLIDDSIDLFNVLKKYSDYNFKIFNIEKFYKIFNKIAFNELKEFKKFIIENNLLNCVNYDLPYLYVLMLNDNLEKILNCNSNDFSIMEKNISLENQLRNILNSIKDKIHNWSIKIIDYEDNKHNNIFNLTGLEKRILKLLLINQKKYFSELKDVDINKFLRRSKEFIIKNTRINLIEKQVIFLKARWKEQNL